MKRTQLQLDEPTYELLRSRAFDRGVSMAAVIREALAEYLLQPTKPRPSIKDFSFIGSGSSSDEDLSPVSERHDEALGKALEEELHK